MPFSFQLTTSLAILIATSRAMSFDQEYRFRVWILEQIRRKSNVCLWICNWRGAPIGLGKLHDNDNGPHLPLQLFSISCKLVSDASTRSHRTSGRNRSWIKEKMMTRLWGRRPREPSYVHHTKYVQSSAVALLPFALFHSSQSPWLYRVSKCLNVCVLIRDSLIQTNML